jgi:Domain of unknown function (DUF4387)
MPKLKEVCRYVRSKNAGPFWVTIDLFFDSSESYHRYRDAPGISASAIAGLYGVDVELVKRFSIDSLGVVKLSIPRLQPQGGVLEYDMHSGQQYVPMLELEVDPF